MTAEELKNKCKEMSGYWEEFIYRPTEFSSDGTTIGLGYKFYLDGKYYGSYFNVDPNKLSPLLIQQLIKLSEIVRNNRSEYEIGPMGNPSPINMALIL